MPALAAEGRGAEDLGTVVAVAAGSKRVRWQCRRPMNGPLRREAERIPKGDSHPHWSTTGETLLPLLCRRFKVSAPSGLFPRLSFGEAVVGGATAATAMEATWSQTALRP
ncbi:unnamed protein product [Hapterophycus canaliculatus]